MSSRRFFIYDATSGRMLGSHDALLANPPFASDEEAFVTVNAIWEDHYPGRDLHVEEVSHDTWLRHTSGLPLNDKEANDG